MDRALIQARIDRGLGLAGAALGAPFRLYRPQSAAAPLAAPPIATLQGMVVRDAGYGLRAPPDWRDAGRFWLGDGALLQPGDLLAGDGAVLFVAAREAATPVLLVACNATLDLVAWAPGPGYGGSAGETVLASGWPASLRLGGGGEAPAAGLPDDARGGGGRQVLLPPIPGVAPARGMRAVDADGRRYVLSAMERSALGWRGLAMDGGN